MSKWVAFLILTSTVCAGISCPDGTVASTSNDECWLFVSEPQDFVFAQKHCQDQGGDLTSIHNKFDNILFADVAKNVLKDSESVITGGNNLINRNSWTWINGDVFDFSAWADYEPANVDTNNCLHVDANTGLWHTKDCRVKAPFVCSITTVSATTTVETITSTTSMNFSTATMPITTKEEPNILPTSTFRGPTFHAPAVGTSHAFQVASEYFSSVLNLDADPCEDFYSYTCGVFNATATFDAVRRKMVNEFVKAAFKPNDDTTPLPVQLVKKQFAECVNAASNWDKIVEDGSIVNSIFDDFQKKTGFPFPLMYNSSDDWPNPEKLANALGYMSTTLGIETLISTRILPNLKEKEGPNPYLLFLDPPILSENINLYVGEPWTRTKRDVYAAVNMTFQAFAAFKNIQLDPVQLESDIEAIVEFEHLLANNYSGSKDVSYTTAFNVISNQNFSDSYKFLDLEVFFANLAAFAPDAVVEMTDPEFIFVVKDPVIMSKLDKALASSFNGLVESRTLYNYLFYRIIKQNMDFFPKTSNIQARKMSMAQLIDSPSFGRHKSSDGFLQFLLADNSRNVVCSALTMTKDGLDGAVNRMVLDQFYTSVDARNVVKKQIGGMVDGIVNGVRSMIDGLTWLTPASKQAAYDKLDKITTNIVSEEWWFDDQALTEEYAHVHNFLNETSYVNISKYIKEFNSRSTFQKLMRNNGTTRRFGSYLTGVTNAWYDFMQNTITFPAGILRSPAFNPEFPRSVIYGSIGMITGHELFHGFDPFGVQFDGEGLLNPWLDEESQRSFQNMTECLVAQYNEFCPLDAAQYSPHCLNGKYTLGENLADNAGIRAAYRAYKNSVAFNGEDPRLPGPLMSQFNHDQLFFLSFSRMWCGTAESANEYSKLLTDPHSRGKYRVLGTLQNYPAFRNAFNCPANSAYAPEDHCNVWISEVDGF